MEKCGSRSEIVISSGHVNAEEMRYTLHVIFNEGQEARASSMHNPRASVKSQRSHPLHCRTGLLVSAVGDLFPNVFS
jgi:hypothetical protein